MINLTVLSLSLSSLYSHSPLVTGISMNFHRFFFQKYSFPIFALNPDSFQLEKSTFVHGIGSILYSDKSKKILADETERYENIEYNSTNQKTLEPKGGKHLFLIRYCNFIKIEGLNGYLIRLNNREASVLITYITIQDCEFRQTPIIAESRAMELSYICCSNLRYTDNTPQFISGRAEKNTFLQFLYSTIYGDKSKSSNAVSLFFSNGGSALAIKNNNISNFKISTSAQNSGIFRIESPSCLNML